MAATSASWRTVLIDKDEGLVAECASSCAHYALVEVAVFSRYCRFLLSLFLFCSDSYHRVVVGPKDMGYGGGTHGLFSTACEG